MFLKPQPGRTVYFEGSRMKVPEEGAEVPEPLSTYWHRRINDGDVMEGSAGAPEGAAPAAAAPVAGTNEHPQGG